MPAGIHSISLGPLPDAIAKLANPQVSVQPLAVEAAVHASKEIALQALLLVEVTGLAMILGHSIWSGGALPVVVTPIRWLMAIRARCCSLFLPVRP
jgi:hypothetical protein